MEDIDYFMCQCDMMEQLQKEYYTVERVVSKLQLLFYCSESCMAFIRTSNTTSVASLS